MITRGKEVKVDWVVSFVHDGETRYVVGHGEAAAEQCGLSTSEQRPQSSGSHGPGASTGESHWGECDSAHRQFAVGDHLMIPSSPESTENLCSPRVYAPRAGKMKTRARKARDSARTKEVVDTVAQTDTVIEPPTSSCEESTVPEDGPVKNYEESAVEMDAPAKDSEEHDATDPSAIQDTAEAENIATEAPAEDSFSAVSVSTQEDSFIAVSVSTQEDSLRTVSVSTQESVIIISDDEDGDCTLGLGNSVLIIEEPHEKSLVAEKRPEELVLDEELAITFTRSGNVMPHARYDCMKYPFVRAEHDTNAPIEKNADVCDECYCYLCDKPAVQCPYWTTVSVCHCNAHNKSVFWKSQRDSALAGILTIFNLDLTEIDADLRHGGFLLLTFIHELSVEYNKYLLGKRVPRDQFYPCTCVCHRGRAMHSGGCNACITYHTDIVVYSYTDVYRKAEELIKKAESEKPKTAAVILLGLVKEVVYQTEPAMSPPLSDPFGSLRASTAMLLGRILSTIQKMLVLSGFPNALSEKFIRFFQSLPLPPHCYCFTNSLSVLPWDDLFLITVLLGQNVTGQRTKKGRKEFLYEVLPVIQARVQKLEEEENYKHLVRYLKAVRCNDTVQLQRLRAKIPFYMCKYGDFTEAAQSLVQLKCISCSVNIILTLDEFTLYLKMLRTESSPSGKHLVEQDEWASQKGVRMRKGVLIKLILRIIYSNKALLQSPKCWGALIKTWCSSPVLGPKGQLQPIEYDEPNIDFQRSVMDIAFPILDELKRHTYVNLPQPFMVMPDEAELILIVRALADKMLFDPIPPSSVLVVILAFGKNVWALRDLLEAITPRNDLVYQFTQKLADELCIQKPIVLHTWSTHGSSYLCELIYTFLTHLNMLVRSVGFHITDILIENFNMLPWARQIADFLQTKVLGTCIFFTPGERNELKKKIAACLAKV